MIKSLALSSIFLLPLASAATLEWQSPSKYLMFQAFHWDSADQGRWYNHLSDISPKLQTLHVTHAWLPPPADSGDTHGYLPRKLDVLNSRYGTADELRRAVKAMKDNGVTAVYDAVFNHRVGTSDWCDFTEPNWPSYYITSGDEGCHTAGVTCSNPNSFPPSTGCASLLGDTGDNYGPARDIDFANPEVIQAVKTYMCKLRADQSSSGLQVPYGGIRFDFVKGYSPSILSQFGQVWNDQSFCKSNTNFTYNSGVPDQTFCVAEYWPDGLDLVSNCNGGAIFEALMRLTGYANSIECGAFDFITKFALNCALNNDNFSLLKSLSGSPPGLIGNMPLKSVTFIDNHDTGDGGRIGSGQRLMALRSDGNDALYAAKLSQAYAYLLTHPGTPSIFHPHFVNFGPTLAKDIQILADIRNSAGIQNNAGVFICQAGSDGGNLYAAYISPTNNGVYTLAMKIGIRTWCPHFGTNSCAGELRGSGENWAVWTNSNGVREPNCFSGN